MWLVSYLPFSGSSVPLNSTNGWSSPRVFGIASTLFYPSSSSTFMALLCGHSSPIPILACLLHSTGAVCHSRRLLVNNTAVVAAARPANHSGRMDAF
mmetsp:Transcript_13892/g.34919  ORF Transcript_13892/g.34919 Transcript_13892/m.34919 type:complete len:97 (-) Transcript_13892:293-583(-)